MIDDNAADLGRLLTLEQEVRQAEKPHCACPNHLQPELAILSNTLKQLSP